MRKPTDRWYLLFILVLAVIGAPAHAARNVILIIGDGMDDQQITIARNYLVGATGRMTLDNMPFRGVSQVLTVSEEGKRLYVADSANSATAIATGVVTSRGRIGTSAGTDESLTTIVDLAKARGLKTGLVSTASVTDATPAVFVAHMDIRLCENPETIHGSKVSVITLPACPSYTKAAGGPGSISEQIAASDVDVVLGGGSKHFDMAAEGTEQTVRSQAQENGFHVIDSAAALADVPRGKKLLGLFSPSTMPVRLQGENQREAELPTPSWANRVNQYLGSVELPATMVCEPNPDFASMPTLRQMTDTALAQLDNERGFFLMIESASIDKQSHERRPCGSIGELAQLNEALDAALAYAESNPDTLIIVTADHAQAAQLVPATSLFDEYGIPVYTPGRVARIETPEGAILAVNYATNSFAYEEHSGANVPVFINDVGVGRVSTMITQPQLFEIMRDYLFQMTDPQTE
jgi:alkaline phosphatase